jgi:hypothetical protein
MSPIRQFVCTDLYCPPRLLGHHVKEDDRGGACSTHGIENKSVKIMGFIA